ncbi:MAG: hypothetical protein V1754_08500 [Pseudomonadota bacterium]
MPRVPELLSSRNFCLLTGNHVLLTIQGDVGLHIKQAKEVETVATLSGN